MALREFTDKRGRRWKVWAVYPTLAERRGRDAGPPPGIRERRRSLESRVQLRVNMSKGWLAFESEDGERRRLAPVPAAPNDWANASVDELRSWCDTADPAPAPRRLIE